MMNESWEDIKAMEYENQVELIITKKIILIFVAIFTILDNTMVLAATWRERSFHQPNKYFIACLAVADLLVGMFVAPLELFQLNLDYKSRGIMFTYLCRFMMWIDTFALTASISSLTFISFNRYLKIRKPLQYRSTMTTSKSLKMIFIIWFISTAFATYSATPCSGNEGIRLVDAYGLCPRIYQVYWRSKGFFTFLAVGVFFLPTVVILIMYSLIYVVVRKRRKMMRDGEQGQTCIDRNQLNVFRQDLKAIRMLLIVVGVFVLCWGPYFIYTLYAFQNLFLIDWPSRRYTFIAEFVIHTLPYINSLCNPIIYACFDQTYRQAFKNLFRRMMRRTSSRVRRPPNEIELRP
ncbi:5-hydroxytryptamine receptor 1-like [Paramuricea clavata]|uniref:5-hydroxytryptamine receptor 1-like n=1 Tax=Paramuricea clavata TaxID=317549 RepID=A0A7D9HW25_PARCT|nr:5-hydroxytryptamine receptor 1-like [Paramuricea clavata]